MATLRVIEVVGISSDGWEAAARAAVAQVSRTIRHIEHLEVVRCTAVVREDMILEYHLRAKLAYRVDDAEEEPSLAVEAAATILAEPVAGDGEELPPLLERQIDEALEEAETDLQP